MIKRTRLLDLNSARESSAFLHQSSAIHHVVEPSNDCVTRKNATNALYYRQERKEVVIPIRRRLHQDSPQELMPILERARAVLVVSLVNASCFGTMIQLALIIAIDYDKGIAAHTHRAPVFADCTYKSNDICRFLEILFSTEYLRRP